MDPYIILGIPSYALFASIGLFTMMLVLYWRCSFMPFEHLLLCIGFMVIGAGIGSKCLFIVTQIPEIFHDFSWKKTVHIIVTGGVVFYGGLAGAIASACLFARLFSYRAMDILNMSSMGFAAFHLWGRIGCFFAGCCYGREASWGFPLAGEPQILRIPIQLIESGCLGMIILILYMIERKLRTQEYSLMIYLLFYAAIRFVLEFYRGDTVRGIWWGGLSTSQWVSAGIIAAIAMVYNTGKRKRKDGKYEK